MFFTPLLEDGEKELSGDDIPEELNEEEVIDIGALAEVQDKVFEAWAKELACEML